MKKLLLLLTLTFTINAYAQDDKTVTLVVSGQGKTQDEAKQNALRSAIEQAFGTFISSKTEILNDNLVKDEIVSVANGNIQKFEIITEVQLPNGNYASTLKATVSIGKLTSFIESKGFSVEFKGSLLAFNLAQQKLMEESEIKCFENFIKIYSGFLNQIYDYKINSNGNPDASNQNGILIPLVVEVKFNSNVDIIKNSLFELLRSVSLDKKTVNNYLDLKISVYPICISISEEKYDYFILRNPNCILALRAFLEDLFAITSDKFCVYTNVDSKCIKIDVAPDKRLTTPTPENPRYREYLKDFVKTQISQEKQGIDISADLFITNEFEIVRRYSFKNHYSNVSGSEKSYFSNNSLRFIKKLEKKIIANKSPYNGMKQFDDMHVGTIISLNESIVNTIYYKYYFQDTKSMNDLKNIQEYLVK